jgi:hypothetical protein
MGLNRGGAPLCQQNLRRQPKRILRPSSGFHPPREDTATGQGLARNKVEQFGIVAVEIVCG